MLLTLTPFSLDFYLRWRHKCWNMQHGILCFLSERQIFGHWKYRESICSWKFTKPTLQRLKFYFSTPLGTQWNLLEINKSYVDHMSWYFLSTKVSFNFLYPNTQCASCPKLVNRLFQVCLEFRICNTFSYKNNVVSRIWMSQGSLLFPKENYYLIHKLIYWF